MRDGLRGQLSIEFIIVLAGLLLVVATVTMPLYNQARTDAEKTAKLADAREAANTIANALNTLYASGPGSKLIIEYWLPEGVENLRIGGWENVDVDGIETTDENVSRNGRADVQIWLDLDGDGEWDNKREAVVLVDTHLPSRWYENGDEREIAWVNENAVHVEDKPELLNIDPNNRALYQMTLNYVYRSTYVYRRSVTIWVTKVV